MASSEFLGLYLPDPQQTPDELFDIDTIINENLEKIDTEVRKYHRTFTAGNWTVNNSASDGYTASITVSRAVHGLNPVAGLVRWQARSNVGGTYKPNTWAAFETIVEYSTSTGNIVIKATSAYAGDILISG